MTQSTFRFVMVRPTQFGFNPETSAINPYQHTPESMNANVQDVTVLALQEFNRLAVEGCIV